MFSYDYIVAAAILTSPLEPADMAPHLELIQPTFMQVALDLEILDGREEHYLQGLRKDPVSDCRALQGRYEALFNAPALAECDRFLERKVIEEFLAFNRAYRRELATRLEVDSLYADHLRTAIDEVDQLYYIWSELRDARSDYYYVAVRRQALQHVRDLVGAEAFYSAQLPSHVPLRNFPYMR